VPDLSANNSPLIIGHRGASAFAPENTMAAFNLAIESGADGIEFDVRLTRDEIPVVIHDESLLRTGGVSQRVSDLLLDDLKQIDVGSWFGAKNRNCNFTGERIPTLENLLRWAESNNARLYLEMKSDASRRQNLAAAVTELLKHFDSERVVIESFDLEALKIIKVMAPHQKTAALFEPSLATPPLIRARRLIELAREVEADEIALHYRLVNKRIVKLALENGFAVVVWTVDEPKWLDTARSLKVSAVITNNPKLLVVQRNSSVVG
jgi:glycerophosphoryl diester phosphodiesterase